MGSTGPAAPPPEGQLAEVWGDVVSRRHLGRAIVIGAVVSLAFYEIGLRLFAPMAATPQVGRAVAMLMGIVGCLVGGTICAWCFAPKRVLSEDTGAAGAEWQQEVLARIEAEGGRIGTLSELPAAARLELQQTGLEPVFAAYEARRAGEG